MTISFLSPINTLNAARFRNAAHCSPPRMVRPHGMHTAFECALAFEKLSKGDRKLEPMNPGKR